ncbi:MAG: glutamine--fructose-6-phosphate transaminase (isomerizing) [Pseudobacteriovorax sp.]|nr:glutamine--fructose-6-phosphate transaminase (isomerizing) [Pseudobacteriovorax sp.]
MCGIVGYIGTKNAVDIVYKGLQQLEYRGYDSAGIAAISGGELLLEKEEGKLINLEKHLSKFPTTQEIAIGHTRWATHGKPSRENAHPHATEMFALVHNGIIENYEEIKSELIKEGYRFQSETDTEVIVVLLQKLYDELKSIEGAIAKTFSRLEGAFSLGILAKDDPESMYLVKQGSPLVIGRGSGENYFGSDITTFAEVAKYAIFLNDGEWAKVTKDSIELWDHDGNAVKIKPTPINWTPGSADKHGYRHYMLKEIHEQPAVISKAITNFVEGNQLNSEALGVNALACEKITNISIVACGTAYIAGMLSKYFLEDLTSLPVNVDLASEFRYRKPHMLKEGKTLVIAVSQSGETADTLASIKHAKEAGCQIMSVCNVAYSSIDRESDSTLLMQAGPEIGVASTKAFTSQILCLYLWANAFSQRIGTLDQIGVEKMLEKLSSLPVHVNSAMNCEEGIHDIVNRFYEFPNFLYVGRGPSYPIALEGALKLKEISYIHAEGYASGELKHGPIALVDKHMPIVALAPKDDYYDKTISNIEEIKAREGLIIGVGDDQDQTLKRLCDAVIACPQVDNAAFQAILTTIPIQFLAYYIAVKRGTDVDQPRNLAKSVTVE